MNKIISDIKTGKLTIGSWIQTGNPVVAEVMASLNYDWIAVDCEHTDISVSKFTTIARAMYGRKALPFVRVRENDILAIRQALDMGAQGIIVPMVNNADQATKAVQAAKYPPEGIRGFCFSRMNDWGENFDKYAKYANDSIPLIVMIESKEAVENIDEILSVPGVDGVFIGPYDMSGSYGCVGQTDHKLIIDAKNKVLDSCAKNKKTAGIHIVLPLEKDIKKAIKQGFTFIALGVDVVYLRESAKKALEVAMNV